VNGPVSRFAFRVSRSALRVGAAKLLSEPNLRTRNPNATRDTRHATRRGRRAARGARGGFSLVEIMVAIAVSALLFGICVAIYVQVSRYKSRSEQLLFVHENARGIEARLSRDLRGLHVADSDGDGDTDPVDYWELESGAMGSAGDRLTFLTAAENAGRLDYCTVRYYVEGENLYRELSAAKGGAAPVGGWPAKSESVLAEDVQKLTVSTEPAAPAAGKVPATVTVTVKLADPQGQPPYRIFTFSLRPGSEEN
jgi:prepilin-type N-terminal cleavage/methylation domain-containing protein